MAKWVTWAHTWGDKVGSGFYDKLVSENRIGANDIMPNIEPYCFYRDAFIELCTCKQDSRFPIPFTSIIEYFNIYKGEEDFEDFIYIIRSMDNAMIETLSKKKEPKNGPRQSGKKNSNKI